MGVEKASMEVAGVPLISSVVAASSHVGPVEIIGGSAALVDLVSRTSSESVDVSHRPDATEDPGPFGAIVSALAEVHTPLALVLSCDLAQLTRSNVDRLCMAQRATNADLAIPVVKGRRQWHAMVISRRIVASLQARHVDGVRSLWRGFSGYSESLVISADPFFFSDVDTPEDVAAITGV